MAAATAKKGAKAARTKPKVADTTDSPKATTTKTTATAAAAAKSPQTTKRKADEDASPVVAKKAKAVAAPKPAKKLAAAAAAKKKEEEQEPEPEPEGAEDGDSEEEREDEALIGTLGLVDDASDSGADEPGSRYTEGVDVPKIPKVSAKARKSAGSNDGSRVIYIGHIPHGFFEHEIRQYLSQFGPITNLRLSRNKKTGASKGYAFVEFEDAGTAAIVAKTMDAYLLFGRVLQVKLVPAEGQHEHLFRGANRRFKRVPWAKLAARQLEEPKGEQCWARVVDRENRRRSGRLEKLRQLMGYELDAPVAVKPVAAALEDGQAKDRDDEPKAIEAPSPAEKEEPVQGAGKEANGATKSPATAKVAKVLAKANRGKKAKAGS